MELFNETPYAAKVFSTVLDDSSHLAVVVVKATYRFAPDGTVELDRTSPSPIHKSISSGELGPIWPDTFARKEDAEVFVYGRAIARGGLAVRELDVSLQIGDHVVPAKVFGRRTWRRGGLGYTWLAGPDYFHEMPLGWDRAYGGRAPSRGRGVPFPDNPIGKGFVLDRDMIDGVELPNIEDPARLIGAWFEQPQPFAFAPLPPNSAMVESKERDNPLSSASGSFASTTSTLNIAHPRLRIPSLVPGDEIVTQHMSPTGYQRFLLRLPAVWVDVRLGSQRSFLGVRLDTLILHPSEWRYVVVGRRAIRYQTGAETLRCTCVCEGREPAAA